MKTNLTEKELETMAKNIEQGFNNELADGDYFLSMAKGVADMLETAEDGEEIELKIYFIKTRDGVKIGQPCGNNDAGDWFAGSDGIIIKKDGWIIEGEESEAE